MIKIKVLKFLKKIIYNLPWNKKRFQKKCTEDRKRLTNNKPITILSTNCIAGEIYHILGLRFDSPTINCSFNRREFIFFCNNLEEFIGVKPLIAFGDDGVITLTLISQIGKVDIKFPHDNDLNEVMNNWEKRKKRIQMDNIYIICDDRGIEEKDFNDFSKIKCKKKILFTAKEYSNKDTYSLGAYSKCKEVGKYNVRKLNGLYEFQTIWDYVAWLN